MLDSPSIKSSDLTSADYPLKDTPFDMFFESNKPLTIWGGLVDLIPNYSNSLLSVPPDLREMLFAINKLPVWAVKQGTDQYEFYRSTHGCLADEFPKSTLFCTYIPGVNDLSLKPIGNEITTILLDEPLPLFTLAGSSEEDAKIVEDFSALLPYIVDFTAKSRSLVYPWFLKDATQAQSDASFKALVSFVGNMYESSSYKFVIVKDPACVLDLQAVLPEDSHDTTSSVVFLRSTAYIFPKNKQEQYFGLDKSTFCPHILHWITQWEQNDVAESRPLVLERLTKGMVCGLRQRLGLGFPNHYVFGMARFGCTVFVYAGTWERKEKVQSGNGPAMADTDTDNKRASKRRKTSEYVDSVITLQETDYKIKIYSLGDYFLATPRDTIYLAKVLQVSYHLVCRYADEIFCFKVMARLGGMPKVAATSPHNSDRDSDTTESQKSAEPESITEAYSGQLSQQAVVKISSGHSDNQDGIQGVSWENLQSCVFTKD